VEAFESLEDIDPIICEYENRSQNKLKIKKSSSNCFRLYSCAEHPSCLYQIFVGKRRDKCFSVKRIFAQHYGHRGTTHSSAASRQATNATDEDEDNKVDKDDEGKDEEDDSDASYKDAKSSEDDTEEKKDNGAGTVDKLFDELLKEKMSSHPWKTLIPLSIYTRRNRVITYP
jgi:hypothetical protein